MKSGFLEFIANPVIFPLFCAVIGLAVGSFLNVVIYRLPKIIERGWQCECAESRGEKKPGGEHLTLVTPRSHCPSCGRIITALENIPVFSWILLRGQCKSCRCPISIRYPIVEGMAGFMAWFAALHFGFGLEAFGAALLIFALIALAFIDFDTTYLPDAITLPLIWCGLLFNIVGTYTHIDAAVIGAMAGYLSLWSVYWLFKLLTGKEGMGYGDFKLLAALGAWFGWQALPLIILLSAVAGALVGISLIVFSRHGRDAPIPFGPYLAIAGLVTLFWGKALIGLYFPVL